MIGQSLETTWTKNANVNAMTNKERMRPKTINKSTDVTPPGATHQNHTEAGADPDGAYQNHHQQDQATNDVNPNVIDMKPNVIDTNPNAVDMIPNAVNKKAHHPVAVSTYHTSRTAYRTTNQDQDLSVTKHHPDHIRHISTNQNSLSTTKGACQILTNFITLYSQMEQLS
jgi:hypothetical protein